MTEFGRDHFRESLKNKDSVLKYLLKVAGDANYPVDVRREVFDLRTDFDLYTGSELARKMSVPQDSPENARFDLIHHKITRIRRMLLLSELGDSELSHMLSMVQENIRE